MQLAEHELSSLQQFLITYRDGIRRSMQNKDIEASWLSNLDQFE
jgi:hypothetical protein